MACGNRGLVYIYLGLIHILFDAKLLGWQSAKA